MAEPAIAEHRPADAVRRRARGQRICIRCGTATRRITPIRPQAQDAPFLWRWRDIEPFLHRSVAEVSINDIERRALILAHPAFGGETTTTSTLLAAFTVLDPGDRARPHRHTGAAIRFATRAEGAATIVNGRRCEMKAGDLILTPPMCWHGHINESDHRIIWFDAANMPLIRALDAHFFEPGDPRNNAVLAGRRGRGGAVDRGRACVAEGAARERGQFAEIPLSRRGDAAAARRGCPPAPTARALIRYVNPATGGAVMPTLDCYAARLAKGAPTRPKRATYNVVCLVVAGEGRSTHRRADLRMVAARRLHHPALDLGAPRGARRRRRPLHGHGQVGVRAARPGARGAAIGAGDAEQGDAKMLIPGTGVKPAIARHWRAAPARRGSPFPARPRTLRGRHHCARRALHCVFVRSPHAHARISEDRQHPLPLSAPGVVAVFTGATWRRTASAPMRPLWVIRSATAAPMAEPPRFALARDMVRHVGEPIAS